MVYKILENQRDSKDSEFPKEVYLRNARFSNTSNANCAIGTNQIDFGSAFSIFLVPYSGFNNFNNLQVMKKVEKLPRKM